MFIKNIYNKMQHKMHWILLFVLICIATVYLCHYFLSRPMSLKATYAGKNYEVRAISYGEDALGCELLLQNFHSSVPPGYARIFKRGGYDASMKYSDILETDLLQAVDSKNKLNLDRIYNRFASNWRLYWSCGMDRPCIGIIMNRNDKLYLIVIDEVFFMEDQKSPPGEDTFRRMLNYLNSK